MLVILAAHWSISFMVAQSPDLKGLCPPDDIRGVCPPVCIVFLPSGPRGIWCNTLKLYTVFLLNVNNFLLSIFSLYHFFFLSFLFLFYFFSFLLRG